MDITMPANSDRVNVNCYFYPVGLRVERLDSSQSFSIDAVQILSLPVTFFLSFFVFAYTRRRLFCKIIPSGMSRVFNITETLS